MARYSGWWWAFEEVAILTERPVALHRDNLGRLHCGDGPALSYPDGSGLHAWRGMPIPAEVAGRLATVTVADIHAETNAEIRRVMLEHFGFERYLRESGAGTRAHSDETGTLWRLPLPDDEPLVMVEVLNAAPSPTAPSAPISSGCHLAQPRRKPVSPGPSGSPRRNTRRCGRPERCRWGAPVGRDPFGQATGASRRPTRRAAEVLRCT